MPATHSPRSHTADPAGSDPARPGRRADSLATPTPTKETAATLSLEQIPVCDADLFSDEHLDDPYPDYKAIRDAGPLVRMSKLDVDALGRYQPVREAVDNWQTFRSGQG